MVYETIKEWGDIEGMQHPMFAYAASADPDTMYYQEAMREPDCAKFIKAMLKEVQSHTENGVLELVPINEIPRKSGASVFAGETLRLVIID